jgi:hypothetical protein
LVAAILIGLVVGLVQRRGRSFNHKSEWTQWAPVTTEAPNPPDALSWEVQRVFGGEYTDSFSQFAEQPVVEWIAERPLRDLALGRAVDRGDYETLFDATHAILHDEERDVESLMTAAWTAIYIGDRRMASDAVEELRVRAGDKETAWLRLKAAWAAADAGIMSEVILEYRDEDPAWHLAAGDEAMLRRQWREASERYERFLHEVPDAHETRLRASYASLRQRDYSAAIAHLDGLFYFGERERWMMQLIRDHERKWWAISGALVAVPAMSFTFLGDSINLAGALLLALGVGLLGMALTRGGELKAKLRTHGKPKQRLDTQRVVRDSIRETGRTV